ncbi:hypothetical protein [Streptomyces sp. NPDC056194]|uniref:hypothetical protein n=1 Tax=unclassified Streptomyces TaxID=2593676 RepID=UPI0035DC04EB
MGEQNADQEHCAEPARAATHHSPRPGDDGRATRDDGRCPALLDVARALAAIHGAVAADTETSRTRDTGPAAAAALDYGLSQRTFIAVSGRSGDVAAPEPADSPRSPTATSRPSTRPRSARWVRQAVRDVRTAPPVPAVVALRAVVDDLAASTRQVGELMLEVAPAYLSDAAAADVLTPLCEAIGEDLGHGLAARRYAMSGDRRALHGTVL